MCKRSIRQKLSAAVYFIYRISFDTFLVEKMLNYECVTIYQKTTISYYAIKVLSMLLFVYITNVQKALPTCSPCQEEGTNMGILTRLKAFLL